MLEIRKNTIGLVSGFVRSIATWFMWWDKDVDAIISVRFKGKRHYMTLSVANVEGNEEQFWTAIQGCITIMCEKVEEANNDKEVDKD
jgi:hypothetical protein